MGALLLGVRLRVEQPSRLSDWASRPILFEMNASEKNVQGLWALASAGGLRRLISLRGPVSCGAQTSRFDKARITTNSGRDAATTFRREARRLFHPETNPEIASISKRAEVDLAF